MFVQAVSDLVQLVLVLVRFGKFEPEYRQAGPVPIPARTLFIFVFLKRAEYMLYRGISFVMRSGFGAEEDYE